MNRATPSTGAVPPHEGGSGPIPRAAGERPRASTRLLGPTAHRGGGVAIGFDPDSDGFRLAVLAADGSALLELGPFPEEEVVALWRSLGGATGLPLLVERPEGGHSAPYPQIGPLALGDIRIRRRRGALSGRRPRFLVRRKAGAWSLRPAVHRDEELFGGVR